MSIQFLRPDTDPYFPDPQHAEDGLVAVGGDLSSERLLHAYDVGVFPWFSEREIPLWWAPDPRAVLEPDKLHVSRRLARRIAHGGFELTWNRAFRDVIRECGRLRSDGTWIHQAMVDAYVELHELGHAHSLEVWVDGSLAAGLYGVQRGGLFAAESKFHRVRDMSKVALVACSRTLARAGVELFDVQFKTAHLERLGVQEWPRARYLRELERVRGLPIGLRDIVPSL